MEEMYHFGDIKYLMPPHNIENGSINITLIILHSNFDVEWQQNKHDKIVLTCFSQ